MQAPSTVTSASTKLEMKLESEDKVTANANGGDGGGGGSGSDKSWPTKLQDRMVASSFDMALTIIDGDMLNQIEPHRAVHLPQSPPLKTPPPIKEDDEDEKDTDADADAEEDNDNKERKSKASKASNRSKKDRTKETQMQSSPSSSISNANQIIPNGGPILNTSSSGVATNELFFASSTQTKTYTIEYSFKRIKPAYLIDSKDFFDYTKGFIMFFVNLLVFLPTICLIAIIFMPYKMTLRLFYRILHMCHLTRTSHISPNKLPEFLNPIELFWLYNSGLLEHDTSLQATEANNPTANSLNQHGGAFHSKNACLFLFDGCLSKNKLRDLVKNRVVESVVNGNKFERFTQRVLNLRSLGFVWIRSGSFDIDEHIIEIDNSVEFESNEEMQSYLSNLVSRHKFDMSKPLWSLYYKQTVNSKTERSSLVLFVFHQAFSDGVSLMRLFLRGIVDNRTQLDVKPRFAYSVLRRNQLKQLIFGWSSFFYAILRLVVLICFPVSRHNKNEIMHMRKRSLQQSSGGIGQCMCVWSDAFDLMQLNKLRLITRSKMNDFLISVVAGIVRQYLQHKGINNPNSLKCLMPIDLRSNKYPMKINGRKSVLCSFVLPIKLEGCVPRLWATKTATQALKSSGDFLLTSFIIKSMFRLFPSRFAFRSIRRLLSDHACVISTIGCGSDTSLATVSVANQNVKSLIYFYPTVGNVSVSFSIITYGDEVRLGMVSDTGVINNPKFITKEFIKQLTILRDLLSNRRIPGELKRGIRSQADFDQLYSHSLIDANQMDDYAVNDMQLKISQIQQELQQLTESMEQLDPTLADYNKRRQLIMIKSDKLRKEFSRMLVEMRTRSREISQAIPSDDEDELEPEERVRLRSASIASRISANSHSRRLFRDSHSEHSNAGERPMSSRKPSLAVNSRQGSLSYSSAHSISRELSHTHQSRANSNVNLHNINQNNHMITVEHELSKSPRHV